MNSKVLAAAFFLLLECCLPSASEVVAALSSGSGVYLEAFSSFRSEYGKDVEHFDVSSGKMDVKQNADTVVAFGGKAALASYPQAKHIVYCMAPGIYLKKDASEARLVKISMIPVFEEIFARIKIIQPSLRRLDVFWIVSDFAAHIGRFKEVGAKYGIEVTANKISRDSDLPGLLRERIGALDAFWIPPDPLLLTPENMMLLREFSWANGIPFYASSRGVVREGAVASVGVSFVNVGKYAAQAVRVMDEGGELPGVIFPDKVEVTINSAAAAKCGLNLSRNVLLSADHLFQ